MSDVESGAPRTQASLGSEWERVYKAGEKVDTIVLAQIIKVNYKYNTAEVMILKNKEVMSKSYISKGKFSAPLPQDFAGRTLEGLPYGQIKPIQEGAIVLIGFLNSKKDNPIILAVYGDSDVNNKLARTPYESADPLDPKLARINNQFFNLYPSLTYDNIDGDGNRISTYPGKTFSIMTSLINESSNISDSNNGTEYADLPESYYTDYKLIEPRSPLAPSMLFKHQGIRTLDGKEDNHLVTAFINTDGTTRLSFLNKVMNWRSYYEADTEGGQKFRLQRDSKVPNQGSIFSEFGLTKNGDFFIVNGNHKFEVRENGIFINDSALADDLGEVLEEIQNRILGINEEIASIIRMLDEIDVENLGKLFDRMTKVETDIISLRNDYKGIDSRVNDLSEDLNNLIKSFDNFKQTVSAYTEANTIRVTAIETATANNTVSIGNINNSITAIEQKNTAQDTKISNLESKVTSLETSNASLVTKVGKLESDVTFLKAENIDLTNALAQLAERVTALENS
ncbi:glycerophosphoryl diester phosphodiesterase [Listeria phage List-36]|uniref:Glycerophosphoryl diester phosphodiesterase n=1 Tax=Listeria phage List-36 TaxID=1486422 RepID=A0A060AFC4_9CAUD|nr:glycerophosphoryl diester phosphodiesterase [Listeria phage List-36]AIA64246.1 glycerophosphoryl diester phosphodiesterase [Listeria phage List-36]